MNSMKANEPDSAVELTDTSTQQTKRKTSELWEWIKSIGFALAIVLVIHMFVFNLSTVKGQSMEPTLQDGEWLFINKIGLLIGSPDRGDIVILKDPDGNLGIRQYLVKRIVGLPGDTVEVSEQKLYINGKELTEPYTDVEIQDWNIMSPNGGGKPEGALAEQINRDFGSFDAFKRHFSQAAEKVEGGGWAILVWSPRSHRLEILQAEKHQNLSQWDVVPLLVLDVWEHAYYLKYQNKRADYIKAWWNTVNWPHVEERYLAARQLMWVPY